MLGIRREGGKTSPPKLIPSAVGSRGVKPQGCMGQIPAMSGPVRRLGPVRPASVAGCGKRKRKSALLWLVPLGHSRVNVYAERNPIHARTRALCSPTLEMISSSVWSE